MRPMIWSKLELFLGNPMMVTCLQRGLSFPSNPHEVVIQMLTFPKAQSRPTRILSLVEDSPVITAMTGAPSRPAKRALSVFSSSSA